MSRCARQDTERMSRCARHDSVALVVPRPNSPLVISSAASKLPIQHYDAPLLSFRAEREILPFGALRSPDQANDVSLRST